MPDIPDALAALRTLTLDQVEHRLAALDAERAALALLRRSLAARDRAARRQANRLAASTAEGNTDA